MSYDSFGCLYDMQRIKKQEDTGGSLVSVMAGWRGGLPVAPMRIFSQGDHVLVNDVPVMSVGISFSVLALTW